MKKNHNFSVTVTLNNDELWNVLKLCRDGEYCEIPPELEQKFILAYHQINLKIQNTKNTYTANKNTSDNKPVLISTEDRFAEFSKTFVEDFDKDNQSFLTFYTHILKYIEDIYEEFKEEFEYLKECNAMELPLGDTIAEGKVIGIEILLDRLKKMEKI